MAVRVLGDVTEGEALDVLRQVDEIYINTIRDFGLYDKIWQAFAVFLPVRCPPTRLLCSVIVSFARRSKAVRRQAHGQCHWHYDRQGLLARALHRLHACRSMQAKGAQQIYFSAGILSSQQEPEAILG